MARKKLDPAAKKRGENFAKKLQEERKNKSMSQDDLSKKANIPVDTIRSIEGKRILSPGLFVAADLVHALDCKLEDWINNNRTTKKK